MSGEPGAAGLALAGVDLHARLLFSRVRGHQIAQALPAFMPGNLKPIQREHVHQEISPLRIRRRITRVSSTLLGVKLWVAIAALLLVLTACTKEPPAYESQYTEPPAAAKAIPVAVIGDSYTGGSPEGGKDANGWPQIAEGWLKGQGVDTAMRIGFEGGSGYVHPGNQRGGVFADQIPKVVNPDDRLVVVFGSRNDKGVPADQLTPAVHNTLTAARAAAPEAKLLVIGPPWLTANPPAEILQARDIVRSQAEAVGAVFVDPIAEGWFVDRPDLIGADGVHPNDAGHAYMADKIAPLIAAQTS